MADSHHHGIYDDATDDDNRIISGVNDSLAPMSTLDSIEENAEAARAELDYMAEKERATAHASGMLGAPARPVSAHEQDITEKFDVDEVHIEEEITGDESPSLRSVGAPGGRNHSGGDDEDYAPRHDDYDAQHGGYGDQHNDYDARHNDYDAHHNDYNAQHNDYNKPRQYSLDEDDLVEGFTQVESEEVIPQSIQAPLSKDVSFGTRMAQFKAQDEAREETPTLAEIKRRAAEDAAVARPLSAASPPLSPLLTDTSAGPVGIHSPQSPSPGESYSALSLPSPGAGIPGPSADGSAPRSPHPDQDKSEKNEDLVSFLQDPAEQNADPSSSAPLSKMAQSGPLSVATSREASQSAPLDPKTAWAKKQHEIDPRPRVAPRKVKEITNWVEPDLYGRGYMGIFGTGAEAKNAQEARRIMDRIKNSRFPITKDEHVDYDNYGRADPRIFGVGSNVASKKEAAAKSAEKQARAMTERKKGTVVFQPADKRLQDKPVQLVHDYVPPRPKPVKPVDTASAVVDGASQLEPGLTESPMSANADNGAAHSEGAHPQGINSPASTVKSEDKTGWVSPVSESSNLAARMNMFEQKDAEASEWKAQRDTILKEKSSFGSSSPRRSATGSDVVKEKKSFTEEKVADPQGFPDVGVPASLMRIPSADLPSELSPTEKKSTLDHFTQASSGDVSRPQESAPIVGNTGPSESGSLDTASSAEIDQPSSRYDDVDDDEESASEEEDEMIESRIAA